MIVIADDFSGAAEIAGVACIYGLKAEVQTELDLSADADVIVIDTDTRSRSAEEAFSLVEVVTRSLQGRELFKKVDSVMRGPLLAELRATLQATGKKRALLVPANPSLGRTIRHGRYLIDGKPLDRTDFVKDPDYPAHTADVLDLLGSDGTYPVMVLPVGSSIPEHGIIIGEASSADDLTCWARMIDDGTVAAGAAGFFSALMEKKRHFRRDHPADYTGVLTGKSLLVSGSSSAYSRSVIAGCRDAGTPVVSIPDNIVYSASDSASADQWADKVIKKLDEASFIIAAIDLPLDRRDGFTQRLCRLQAQMTARVLDHQPVDNLFIEGGATASAIIRLLGWRRLRVSGQLAPGIICMKTGHHPHIRVTTKPGSYQWPCSVPFM